MRRRLIPSVPYWKACMLEDFKTAKLDCPRYCLNTYLFNVFKLGAIQLQLTVLFKPWSGLFFYYNLYCNFYNTIKL